MPSDEELNKDTLYCLQRVAQTLRMAKSAPHILQSRQAERDINEANDIFMRHAKAIQNYRAN